MAKIEEKAKAYNGNYKAFTELIDRLEDVKEAIKKQNYGIAMDILYKPYPEFQITTSTELKESEDERIRKGLLYVIEHHPTLPTEEAEEYITWLEKQSEQIDIVNKEYWRGYREGKQEVFDKYAWIKKQGEKKPAETEKGAKGNEREIPISVWSEEDETKLKSACAIIRNTSLNGNEGIVDSTITFLKSLKDRVQPKQEWSERDKEEFQIAIDTLVEAGQRDSAHWLKSLKDRVQPQNLTVTDEELAQAKKDAYNDALDKIEYHSGEPTFDDGWNAAIWYLKKRNAQPKNTWKPSGEQMQALKDALNDAIMQYDFKGSPIKEEVTRKHAETIESLYNDLKKLMEE